MAGGWRKLHFQGLRNLYSSPIFKSRMMSCPVHIARMGAMRYGYNISLSILENLEDADGR
jgi:hypothetical protein